MEPTPTAAAAHSLQLELPVLKEQFGHADTTSGCEPKLNEDYGLTHFKGKQWTRKQGAEGRGSVAMVR